MLLGSGGDAATEGARWGTRFNGQSLMLCAGRISLWKLDFNISDPQSWNLMLACSPTVMRISVGRVHLAEQIALVVMQ